MYIHHNLYLQDINRVLKTDLSFLEGKCVFITGASGLVGSFLIDVLMQFNQNAKEKIDIYATFTSEKTQNARFQSYIGNPYFHGVILNITNPIMPNIRPDYILHAASNTHPKAYAEFPVETMKINILGTLNILDWAKSFSDCRVLFLSTMEIYGENNSINGVFAETDIGHFDFLNIRSCYPESKRTCELLTKCYAKEYNMQTLIARLGYIYGPTVHLTSSKADVQFLNNALKHEDIVLKSSGRQKRSYIYVADVITAILTLFQKGTNAEAYNIASKEGNICLKDFAETLAEFADVNVVFDYSPQENAGCSMVQNSMLDASKLEQLGWKPQYTLHEGIEHTFLIKKDIKAC